MLNALSYDYVKMSATTLHTASEEGAILTDLSDLNRLNRSRGPPTKFLKAQCRAESIPHTFRDIARRKSDEFEDFGLNFTIFRAQISNMSSQTEPERAPKSRFSHKNWGARRLRCRNSIAHRLPVVVRQYGPLEHGFS